MNADTENKLRLRAAKEEDVPVILKFILELAEYEGVKDRIQSTEKGLRDVLFDRHITEALIAEWEGIPIGFAIWAYSFSTFTGKPTLYIDDLYVQEPCRGKGVGSRLFARIAEIACEKDCGRIDWYCMNTNGSGIDYYHKLGAEEIDWFKVFRLNRAQIEEMRDGS
ncbi:MAG: GNAT family N-acetyltransferase [Eubacteriales bacterium]|nr:GNAT family N-acetyltransferase [Eubacteriales bacterium]